MKIRNEIEILLSHILDIDKISNTEWVEGLDERKKKELEFHDKDRDNQFVEKAKAEDTYEQFYGNRKYYSATARSKNYVERWIKQESKGKIFLDYACGNGLKARLAAQNGSRLSLGFDISAISVQNAKKYAKEDDIQLNKEGGVCFFQADAENTLLPDNCIDSIICSGMLHHLDLSYAFPELYRILKPGGKILAVEALNYNPFIKLYRYLTPSMRTDWEKSHILSMKDLKLAKQFFKVSDIKYWHIFGYIGGKFPFLLSSLDILDRIFERVPLIKKMSWMFTFVLIKDENS